CRLQVARRRHTQGLGTIIAGLGRCLLMGAAARERRGEQCSDRKSESRPWHGTTSRRGIALRDESGRRRAPIGYRRGVPGTPSTACDCGAEAESVKTERSAKGRRRRRSLQFTMKTEQFLSHHGIVGNPFSEEDAQTDTVFKRRCLAT